ncbi:hypothetical protein BRARA_E02965 [Brassica rapa]|uniref:TF-B3 domain-containing protein n=1 Tax=Brassica campestris TaxID=3711 RepID=A0A397ZEZ0_BRACM|nr:hypothetical protein BRARA_E02965 [Brassica rapa]
MANASASSPTNPHFFKPLLPSFQSHLNIPMTFFSKHIRGTTNEDNTVVTLTSDASDKTWEVKMDGRRLTRGWQNFANGHGLRVGDIVIFRRDGDLLFHVTSFGPSCCQILYDDVMQKYHQDTREEGSPSDNSCFVARVTASNLSRDMLFFPRGFSRSNGLTNRKCEIILLNEDGKPWKVFMSYHKTHGRVYIRTGWRRFCRQNRRRSNDLLTFKLVETGTKPVLQCLPAAFLKSNGITNARKIIPVDRYGIKRTTSLKPDNNNGAMRMGKGWRELCKANGVKAGESFTLELIKEEGETATHLLKFCTKI